MSQKLLSDNGGISDSITRYGHIEDQIPAYWAAMAGRSLNK
jgi:hypothetical protein